MHAQSGRVAGYLTGRLVHPAARDLTDRRTGFDAAGRGRRDERPTATGK
ncbi:hypothetical protein [Paludisphaera soli]|nr:hypothetical protein [Paludisphaera soli]